jgi:hypothetical protein
MRAHRAHDSEFRRALNPYLQRAKDSASYSVSSSNFFPQSPNYQGHITVDVATLLRSSFGETAAMATAETFCAM